MTIHSPRLNPSYVPSYLAVFVPDPDLELPHLFTPKAMRWSDHIWLLDLSACRSYWQKEAAARGLAAADIFLALLCRQVGAGIFHAALSDVAWQALVLLEYMVERDLGGLINADAAFGRGLSQQVSWDAWAAAAKRYGTHCQTQRLPGFNAPIFRRQLSHLLAAAKRLSLARPLALAEASSASMRRRFGAHVALLWEWSFALQAREALPQRLLFPDEEATFASAFPWLAWSAAQQPTITRHLDYPVWQWAQIEPLLGADFDRLCAAEGWRANEAVLHLIWQLTLDDSATLQVDIRFRHPHRLHAEHGQQQTALLQSSYAFSAQFRPKEEVDETLPPPPIIAWRLTVAATMSATTALQDIFGEIANGDPQSAQRLRLENQLPVAVEHFAIAGDWAPEYSFAAAPSTDRNHAEWGPWLAIAGRRPLYIYREPLIVPATESLRRVVFLERTAMKWWSSGSPAERDYFVLEDFKDKWRWAYKEPDGRWRVHGVFA